MLARLIHSFRVPLALVWLAVVLLPYPAAALSFRPDPRKPLVGEMEWLYADYRSKSSTGEDFEASHFVQKYSLLYQFAGNIYHSRAGAYNLSLGLEWWKIDTDFGDENISLSHLKPLYSGELLLAPAGLPFRLHLFAYDRASASFAGEDYVNGVVDSNIITDVFDGERRVIGGTLTAGIKNGSYLGEYREGLSKFPKLYIDFRQEDVRDLEGANPQHYRDRNLAFVSLNKKDNWFHYRLYEHKDYIDSDNDYSEKVFQLGTIDHQLYRQWIWLTNWVRLSTDGSFTTTDNADLNSGKKEHLFDYNLFLVGRKDRLSFANLNTFSRRSHGDVVEADLQVPLMFAYDISPDRAARFQFLLERYQDRFGNLPAGNSESDNVYLAGKLETGLIHSLRLDPSLEMEVKEGSRGRGRSVRGSVELYTNPRYRADQEWLLAYSLANLNGTGDGKNASNVNYLEQTAEASIAWSVNPTLRVGATQTLLIGTGELDGSISDHVRADSDESWFDDDDASGDALHSTTEFFAEHNRARLGNRLSVLVDILKVSDQSSQTYLELRHRLRYDQGQLNVSMINELRLGDQDGYQGFTVNQVSAGYGYDKASDITFEHHTVARYLPNRNWLVRGLLDYLWRGGGDNDIGLLRLRENTQYSFIRTSGIQRRWLELHQALEIEQSWEDVADSRTYGNFTLGAIFYPTYNTYLRGDIGYEWYDPGARIFTYGLGLGVDFPLFKVEARYEYGTSDDNDTGETITDHRWELNVKKLI